MLENDNHRKQERKKIRFAFPDWGNCISACGHGLALHSFLVSSCQRQVKPYLQDITLTRYYQASRLVPIAGSDQRTTMERVIYSLHIFDSSSRQRSPRQIQ